MSPIDRTLRALATLALARQALVEVARALGPDVRIMPLKGVLLAGAYYPDPGERQTGDCDVLLLDHTVDAVVPRLTCAGFRVIHWSNDAGVVELIPPRTRAMMVDLHARPLPVGLGGVTARWMATGAREDRARFDVPVWLPDDTRLLVHLLGNILRDHVHRARPHTARDVSLVLGRITVPMTVIADTVRSVRLARGAWMALSWVATQVDDPLVGALRHALALTPREQRIAARRLEWFHTWSREEPPPWPSRWLARCPGDAPGDVVRGLASAAFGTVRARLRNAHLPRETVVVPAREG